MNIFDLTAKLTLDDTEYKQKLENLKKENEKASTSNTALATKGVGAWGAIAGAITGVIAAVATYVKMIKDAIMSATDYAGTIKDLAQVYGETYERIQEVNYLAQESGKNAEWAIRKAQASGQEYWEVLGLTNEEYRQMIDYAHEMGIILSDEVVDSADMLGDRVSQLKYQWQSLLTGLLAGDENIEEKLQAFFDRVLEAGEEFAPAIIKFVIYLMRQIAIAMIKIAPQLLGEVITACIDLLFSVDWFKVGLDIAKSFFEGFANIGIKVFNKLFGWTGLKIPEIDFGGSDGNYINTDYEITERVEESLTIRVESDGVTENDKAVANSLEDLIDEKIGKMLGGI